MPVDCWKRSEGLDTQPRYGILELLFPEFGLGVLVGENSVAMPYQDAKRVAYGEVSRKAELSKFLWLLGGSRDVLYNSTAVTIGHTGEFLIALISTWVTSGRFWTAKFHIEPIRSGDFTKSSLRDDRGSLTGLCTCAFPFLMPNENHTLRAHEIPELFGRMNIRCDLDLLRPFLENIGGEAGNRRHSSLFSETGGKGKRRCGSQNVSLPQSRGRCGSYFEHASPQPHSNQPHKLVRFQLRKFWDSSSVSPSCSLHGVEIIELDIAI
ncbi:hypothetical protein BJ508DRAFT_350399 [Ascobolus immersus RN42]|uniref:Uncharacterized protein n=1 Tax=Ascobolus immersus RN42 TaxID=1160509 RepID=A0A3N4II97_ASCIM|nr:hypothetical protein BJ508DRAFT_350399 [Ascobolus immersus RN42]